MGALHAGHIKLVETCRAETDTTVVSIFVNPLQFGPGEDFARYPRDEAKDLGLLEAAGVDAVYLPASGDLIGTMSTCVRAPSVSDRWEGQNRPGHFDGVATIVTKLYNIVQPTTLYFGLKDLQQCAVVRQTFQDLNIDVDFRFVETVREPDGLALSSRNVRLTSDHRRVAPELYKTLCSTTVQINEGGNPVGTVLEQAAMSLSQTGFQVDYLALVDPNSMEPIDHKQEGSRLIVAARLGDVRLLDTVGV